MINDNWVPWKALYTFKLLLLLIVKDSYKIKSEQSCRLTTNIKSLHKNVHVAADNYNQDSNNYCIMFPQQAAMSLLGLDLGQQY